MITKKDSVNQMLITGKVNQTNGLKVVTPGFASPILPLASFHRLNYEQYESIDSRYKDVLSQINLVNNGINHAKNDYTINKNHNWMNKFEMETVENMGKYYLEKMAEPNKSITMNESICSGKPVIANTRVDTALILACLKDNMTKQEICDEYHLSNDEIDNVLDYCIKVLDYPFQEDEE